MARCEYLVFQNFVAYIHLTFFQLLTGIRNGHVNDAHRLHVMIAKLINQPGIQLSLTSESKSDRGFNHDVLGRLLLPIQHVAEYNEDPVG